MGEVALKQAQDILTVKNTTIGDNGTASYFHNGGTFKVLQDLTLGTAAYGEGYYNMLGGSLSVGGDETLGLAGAGYLSQSEFSISTGTPPSLGCTPHVTPPPPVNPTHSVGKNLYLGVESHSYGEFLLSNSSLNVGGSTRVGIDGTGYFEQNNSTVKIKGNDIGPLDKRGHPFLLSRLFRDIQKESEEQSNRVRFQPTTGINRGSRKCTAKRNTTLSPEFRAAPSM